MMKGELTDLMFSWSVEDIFNENLYKNQVEKIPGSFQSVEHYLGSYVFPLLEETRAELASSMEIINKAPFAKVIYLNKSELHGNLLYNVKVDYWRNRFNDRVKEPYRTLPGDIFVISDVKPETVSDLQRMGRTWTFASVTNITENENEDDRSSTRFKIKASKDIEVKDGMWKSKFVVFLINITTSKRIWNTLHMFRNLKIIEEVLCTKPVVEENCDICSVPNNSQLVERFSTGFLSKLNKFQTDAILASLLKMECNHKAYVKLIWGPPGTGKTMTVSVMLFSLWRLNHRILACAPTNVAIKEVSSRVLKMVKESFEAESARDALFCSLGDILLFGNEDRLKIGSDIKEIYLDYRVKRLVECLGPLTGWKHCLNSMINFLEDCVSHYHIFVGNELIKEKKLNDEGEASEVEFKSFLEFARARFKYTASQLRRCLFMFCTHLPKRFILEHNFQNMVSLINLLDSLETLLFQENVISEELEELLSYQEIVVDTSESLVDTSLLLCMRRSECLSALRTLWHSLEELNLPRVVNKYSIMEFCFRSASLIFCTASSSYKLHWVEMEPLNLLVIDEAAQLKECESTIPLQLPGMRHAILIGDERQLPAMVRSEVSGDAGFGRSLFERLSSSGHPKHLLNIQYRMHPKISFFPNSNFYQNWILDAPNVKSKSYERHYLPGPMFGPYSFINVVGGKEELDDVGHSRRNMVEVAIVLKIVQNLYRAWNGSKRKLSIGVVSPYSAQVVAIQEKLGRKYENLDGFMVKAKSIDGFQGGEEDIIIISTVRTNSGGCIGFISSPQRTNVALTRARHCLWILGNERTLSNSKSVWAALVQDAKHRQCFFNADEDNDLAKAILDVKKELNQLDDLLNGDCIFLTSARWKVIFSDQFRKSFGKLMSVRTKKAVMNLLLKLSSGWRPKKRNVDSVCESSSQIVKQFKVEGLYVVCTIDIVKESRYIQVLKVWDILPLEKISKLVKQLDSIFAIYTDDFINCCKEKCLEGDLEIPKSWGTSYDIVQFKNFSIDEFGSGSSVAPVDGGSYVENSKKFCLVQVKQLDESLAQAMQVASSLEEWKARGIKLFWENKYETATMCFERAGDTMWEKRAKAAGLNSASDRLHGSNPEMASTGLREAAEIFDSIGRAECAAKCFCDLGEYERSANIEGEEDLSVGDAEVTASNELLIPEPHIVQARQEETKIAGCEGGEEMLEGLAREKQEVSSGEAGVIGADAGVTKEPIVEDLATHPNIVMSSQEIGVETPQTPPFKELEESASAVDVKINEGLLTEERWNGIMISSDLTSFLKVASLCHPETFKPLSGRHVFFRRFVFESIGRVLQIFHGLANGNYEEPLLSEAKDLVEHLKGVGASVGWLDERLSIAEKTLTRASLRGKIAVVKEEIAKYEALLSKTHAEYAMLQGYYDQLECDVSILTCNL